MLSNFRGAMVIGLAFTPGNFCERLAPARFVCLKAKSRTQASRNFGRNMMNNFIILRLCFLAKDWTGGPISLHTWPNNMGGFLGFHDGDTKAQRKHLFGNSWGEAKIGIECRELPRKNKKFMLGGLSVPQREPDADPFHCAVLLPRRLVLGCVRQPLFARERQSSRRR